MVRDGGGSSSSFDDDFLGLVTTGILAYRSDNRVSETARDGQYRMLLPRELEELAGVCARRQRRSNKIALKKPPAKKGISQNSKH